MFTGNHEIGESSFLVFTSDGCAFLIDFLDFLCLLDRNFKIAAIFAALCFAMPPSTLATGIRLVVSDIDIRAIYEVDPATGESRYVGLYKANAYIAGLAYDPQSQTLYGSSSDAGALYRIDATTGVATLIGYSGVTRLHGLAFDNASRQLYACFGGNGMDNLYVLSTLTGAATWIGPIGFFTPDDRDVIYGLDFHPTTRVLYGCMFGPSGIGALITIDTVSGRGTLVANTEPLTALAFHPETHVLYGINNWTHGTPASLWTINPESGAATSVGELVLSNPLGLTFIGSTPIAVEATSWSSLKGLFRDTAIGAAPELHR